MTGTELRQRRENLNLTVQGLADYLDEHPDEIRKWEQITSDLPKSLDRRIEWVLATEERAKLMKASGIEECSWVEQHLGGVDSASADALERRLREAEEHAKTCSVCQRREAFAASLPPLPPIPLPAYARPLVWVVDRIQQLPKWMRPAATGAILIGGLVIVRAVFVLVFRRAPLNAELLWGIIAAIGIGAYGGAIGGLAYGAVRERFRKLGRLGDYFTGVVCVYAYLLAFGIPLALFTDEEMFQGALGWIIMAIVGTLFGVIIGHSWFRDEQPSDRRGA